MPRPSKGARLYFREVDGKWYIRDGQKLRSTGRSKEDREGAEKALAAYLGTKHQKPKFGIGNPDNVHILDVLLVYQNEHGPHTRRPDVIATSTPQLGDFWQGKVVGEITKRSCRDYVALSHPR